MGTAPIASPLPLAGEVARSASEGWPQGLVRVLRGSHRTIRKAPFQGPFFSCVIQLDLPRTRTRSLHATKMAV